MSALIKVPETTLDVDAVESMALALNRAKGWLAEAVQIEDVREAKAAAVSVEAYIKEKELAFDAQLSATEIVRRCERRIGELVREGQQDGTVLSKSQTLQWVDSSHGGEQPTKVHEAFGVSANDKKSVADGYALADTPAEDFEQALADAKAEGNLSRANVVRKVKGERAPKADRSEWHRNTRHINSDRILLALTQEIDAAAQGLDLMDPAELDADLLRECVPAIRQSITVINRHLRRISND